MHTKARSATFLLVLLVFLLAGCGGGSGGTEDQQGGQQGGQQEGQADQSKKNAPETKIALGTVKRVNYEKERMVIRPSQGEGLMTFGVRPEARVTLDGEKAELKDVKQGQQAQIEYIQNNDLMRARSIQLFSAGGQAEETN